MAKVFNVALASYGMSGRVFHAPFIAAHPGLALSVILERRKNASRERYPNATIVRDYQAIIDNPAIDLVVVNTPNALHYEMSKQALLAGKHVVVEKPFTTTVEQGRELIELAEQQGLMLSVYHNRRLQSGFLTAQQLLDNKTLGEIKTFETSIDRYRPEPGPKKWKEERNPGAGLLYDLGSHLLDEALILFGLPQSLYADLRIERAGGQVCDYFHLRLDYPQHKCLLTASMLAQEPAPAYVLHGTQGSYIKQIHDIQEGLLAEGIRPNNNTWAVEQAHQWGFIRTAKGRETYPTVNGRYQDYYHNIYCHLTENAPLLVLADQALVTVGMIALVERSAAEQCSITLA